MIVAAELGLVDGDLGLAADALAAGDMDQRHARLGGEIMGKLADRPARGLADRLELAAIAVDLYYLRLRLAR